MENETENNDQASEPIPETWVELAGSLNDTQAEVVRGYLEAQGIPVQIRISKRGTSFLRMYYWSEGPFRIVDIFVPERYAERAFAILQEVKSGAPDTCVEDGVVLVYDDDGAMCDLDVSSGARCPNCDRIGIEYSPKQTGFPILLWLIWMLFVDAVLISIFVLRETMSPVIIGLALFILSILCIFLTIPILQSRQEKWYCLQCGKEWYK